jgi:hypothetical protein
MEKRLPKYRKIGKRDGGEPNRNLYRVTHLDGTTTTYPDNRAAKIDFKQELAKKPRKEKK